SIQYSFFFLAEDGIRDGHVTGVQTCALPIYAYLEKHATRREFRRQRVRIRHFQISIPTKHRFTVIVRERFDDDLFAVGDRAEGLDHDHRPIAANNPEKLVLRGWASKRNLKTQHIAIERERRRDVSD